MSSPPSMPCLSFKIELSTPGHAVLPLLICHLTKQLAYSIKRLGTKPAINMAVACLVSMLLSPQKGPLLTGCADMFMWYTSESGSRTGLAQQRPRLSKAHTCQLIKIICLHKYGICIVTAIITDI